MSGSGQRGNMSQPFYIPTLMPMSSLQQQPVVVTCSGNGVTPVVISNSSFGQSSGQPAVPVPVIQQPNTSSDLYLCATSKNATDSPIEDDAPNGKKVSIEILKESYKELNPQKIKDSLSSFLPDTPGEFDSTDFSETKLRHLLDQRLFNNKEFLPLSGHALLGFRLLPGPLPEQYRIDPPLQESRSHHRKKKHKHRSIEKAGEDGSDLNPPSSKVKMPADAYSFMKSDSSSSLHISTPSQPTHGYSTQGERSIPQKVVSSGAHVYPPAMATSPSIVGNPVVDPLNPFPGGKKKKEKKRNKEKKKEKKEKKKKKDKHHSQDPPVSGPGPSQPLPHPPPAYS